MPDIVIIGGGPAGLSAALTAINRGKSTVIVSLPPSDSGLHKAGRVDNYPGLPGISGADLHDRMLTHAIERGAEMMDGRVTAVTVQKNGFFVAVGSDIITSKAIVLASGVSSAAEYPGEKELLGHGVSYCATCDGMLYRGKRVAVIGRSSDAEREAGFLRGIGVEVLYFTGNAKYSIEGGDTVKALNVGGERHEVSGVFIFRPSIAVSSLIPGVETEGGYVKAGRDMSTSVPGIYAAGDCIGKPYQIAKAVGEGNVAGLAVSEWIDTLE